MKVTWEAEDITAGRRYSRPGITETWMIGWRSDLGGETRYVSVSLADGMVTQPKTREEIASDLTANGYLPVELMPAK